MTASLHTPPCPGVYHPGPQYSKFQTWLQKFLTLFEREDSSPFLNLGGLVLQRKWCYVTSKRPCSFHIAGRNIHTRILSYNTRGPTTRLLSWGGRGSSAWSPVLLHPVFQLSLPSEEPCWKWILQLQLVPTFSHLRHCRAEKSHAFSQFLTCSTTKWLLFMLLSIGVVC